jgi:hypothetical protein
LSVIFVDFYIIDMSQTLNSILAFDGKNYGYWKARMRFFLKSIDWWSIVETGWTKPADATLEAVPQKNAQLSNDKASMLCANHFHHLNSQRFQTVNHQKKHGKFWKQHMKAQNL